jgi:hypothetical protein
MTAETVAPTTMTVEMVTTMKKVRLALQWEGTFIELCLGRVTPAQKERIDRHCKELNPDVQSLWYENTKLLKSVFDADNWWSVDDLDHAMGLVFADRPELDRKLAGIALEIDGSPASIDPEALQLSFYIPESVGPLARDERVACHGIRRQAVLRLEAEVEPDFDPSLITLSFLHYPDVGTILIDLDVDGHDDVNFTWGETTYLEPRFVGKEHFDETSR